MTVVTRLPAQMLSHTSDAHLPDTVVVGTLPTKSGPIHALTHNTLSDGGPSELRIHQFPHAIGAHRHRNRNDIVDVRTRRTHLIV